MAAIDLNHVLGVKMKYLVLDLTLLVSSSVNVHPRQRKKNTNYKLQTRLKSATFFSVQI